MEGTLDRLLSLQHLLLGELGGARTVLWYTAALPLALALTSAPLTYGARLPILSLLVGCAMLEKAMTQLLPPLLRVLRASSAASSAADEYLYFWRWQLRRMGGLLALLALLSSALRPRKLRTRGAPRRRRPASNGAAEDPGAPRARYRSIAPPSSPAAAAAARRTLRAAMARRRVRRAALKDDQPLSIGEGDFDTAAEATGDRESGGSAEEGGSPLRVHGGLEVAVSCPTPSVLSSSPPHSTQDGSPERGQRCEADEEGSTAGGRCLLPSPHPVGRRPASSLSSSLSCRHRNESSTVGRVNRRPSGPRRRVVRVGEEGMALEPQQRPA